MDEVRDRVRLVDASAFDGRGVTATVPRAEIESVLASADGPPELVLDVQRREGDEIEAHTLRIEWDPKELEELLRTTTGEQVDLVLDGDELERAIQDDVEAHGLREKAAIFAVAVVAAGGAGAGAAMAGPTNSPVTDGGGASGSTPIAMVSDAGSGGPQTSAASLTAAQSDANMVQAAAASQSTPAPEVVSDAALSGPQTSGSELTAAQSDANMVQSAAASQTTPAPEIVSDAATTGPVAVQAAQSPEMVADSALSGPVAAQAAQSPEMVADSALSGPAETPMTPQQIVDAAAGPPQMVSDAALSGPVAQPEATGGGGWDISAPDPTTTAIVAGGIALMITAAGFAVRGQRRQLGHPA
jgi:hypothetical protein